MKTIYFTLSESMKLKTMDEVDLLLGKLKKAVDAGILKYRKENNVYLFVSCQGTDKVVSSKWNIKIYNYSRKRKGFSVVCNDVEILRKIYNERHKDMVKDEREVISIDDSGWGFPLCGVMVGVECNEKIRTNIVGVEYFQGERFKKKEYLHEYAERGLEIVLVDLDAKPGTHRIEICTGFINSVLKRRLRKIGFNVKVTEIKGKLQDTLEKQYKCYVRDEIGEYLYYDPKDMSYFEIARNFKECVDFAWEHCPDKIKSGWEYFERRKND